MYFLIKCSGYMSPEYAMGGQFSEKSDVFSFGVLLLEIINGRKNTGFYLEDNSASLIGYVSSSYNHIVECQSILSTVSNMFAFQAWKLWNEDNVAAFIDPVIADPIFQLEILRCIHVGLLCVQEFAKDRPTMSTVTSMLNSDIMDLPTPRQPAFTAAQIAEITGSSEKSSQNHSVNYMSTTFVDPR